MKSHSLMLIPLMFALLSCANNAGINLEETKLAFEKSKVLFLDHGKYVSEPTEEMLAMLRGIKHVSMDMDGTIYLGSTLFPYTVPFLEQLDSMGIGYCFLTNNSSKSLDAYIARLENLGVPCRPDQMVSTTAATIDYIKQHYPEAKHLFLLGTPSMISQFEAAGFISCADDPADRPDVIVAGFDMTVTYDRLCRCAWWASHKDIPYIATNPDKICPTDQETILLDCGSIYASVESASGRKPDVVIGKPNPDILLSILKGVGVQPTEAAMVGDRLSTDVKSALNAGSCGVLVLTGDTTLDVALNSAPEDLATIICATMEEFGQLLIQARR